MALGERIKACRQRMGMSQEKVAELMGVSRQAVTKWEANQSAPNTENLFRLAELFGTTTDLLLAAGEEGEQSPSEKSRTRRRETVKQNITTALLVAGGYGCIYLMGRILWCDLSQSSLMGWLFAARPAGEHSYLYGWLLSSNLFLYGMAISVIPAFFGAHRFSYVTLMGFAAGLVSGIIFGPYPEGAAIGQSHYGWAIWGAVYLVSIGVGIIAQRWGRKSPSGGHA